MIVQRSRLEWSYFSVVASALVMILAYMATH